MSRLVEECEPLDSGAGAFVRPRPGRMILMDQDVTHRVSAPSALAQRPRYSLVWKLVFFPRSGGRSRLSEAGPTLVPFPAL